MNTPHIKEAARDIPVLMQADVVVVGGGTTGPIAAIAAARRGCKVVLIERFGSLGGVLTLGLNTKPSGSLLGGIPLEIWNLARSAGGAGADYMATTKTGGVKIASPADPEIMKMLLTRLGWHSTMVVTGDPAQTDLLPELSGLADAANRLQELKDIAVIRLADRDIVRHPLVASMLTVL